MGLFDKLKKKKESNINFDKIVEDTIYDLKNNPEACTLYDGIQKIGKQLYKNQI